MAHDFLNQAFCSARFFVVHTCTKSVYETHKKFCTRISNSSSPAMCNVDQLVSKSYFQPKLVLKYHSTGV